MVIRRIREHVTTHNWFAVAIDLAIVVAGVFLGTQVSNWNESRLETARPNPIARVCSTNSISTRDNSARKLLITKRCAVTGSRHWR